MFTNSVIETASEAFILSIKPTDSLNEEQKKNKIYYIHARNRVLKSLYEEALNLKDEEQKKILIDAISKIENFYVEIGGEIEKTTSPLSMFSPTKFIEGKISGSIIESTKPDTHCTEKEIAKKKEQKTTRDQIIKAIYSKASDEAMQKKVKKFFELVGGAGFLKKIGF